MKRNTTYIALLLVCTLLLTSCQNGETVSVTSSPSSTETVTSAVTSKVTTSAVATSEEETSVIQSSTPVSSETIKPKIKPKKVSKMTHDEIIKEIELTCGFDLPSSAELLSGKITFSADEDDNYAVFSTHFYNLCISFSDSSLKTIKSELKKKCWSTLEVTEFYDLYRTYSVWSKQISEHEDALIYEKTFSVQWVSYDGKRGGPKHVNYLRMLLLPNEHTNTCQLFLKGTTRNENYFDGTIYAVDKKGNKLTSANDADTKQNSKLSDWSVNEIITFSKNHFQLHFPNKSFLDSVQLQCSEKNKMISLKAIYTLNEPEKNRLFQQLEQVSRWEAKDITKAGAETTESWVLYQNEFIRAQNAKIFILKLKNNETYQVEISGTISNSYGFEGAFAYNSESQ